MLGLVKRVVKEVVIGRLRRADAKRRAASGHFGGLPPQCWGCDILADGTLGFLGHRAADLAREFGTPLHVVNVPRLTAAHAEFIGPFRAAYPRTFLATSYKTNPLPVVLKHLHNLGTHAEVISDFELWLAATLGLDGKRIIVNGPGKTRSLIARAVAMKVKVINIDGLGEIDLIAEEAARAGGRQPVGVRVITSVGWSSQFGLSLVNGDALEAFKRIAATPQLEAIGLHLHIGTGLKDVASYVRAIREVTEFARVLRTQLGVKCTVFDFGGGFGVPTVRGADEWDDRMVALGYAAREAFPADCPTPSDYTRALANTFEELISCGPPDVELFFEPGRAITSAAQSLLLSIVAIKESRGSRKLIVDGGKNITLPLGWETHKIFPGRELLSAFDIEYDLYGPLCHPGDIVALHRQLPAQRVGDVVAIMDAGAYFIPNQMTFSNPRPAVIGVDHDGVRVLRRRESFEDIVRLDRIGDSRDDVGARA